MNTSTKQLFFNQMIRKLWSKSEISQIYRMPWQNLIFEAAQVHRKHWDPLTVQRCTLLSIKTGGCTEDCKYCSQSVQHKTFVKPTPMMKTDEIINAAKEAKESGSTRFCMGSAWREMGKKKKAFRTILEAIREIKAMDLQVCCTLGMVTQEQAKQLKDAGLFAYNHNLDTSREHYPKVITTRTYDDRLDTLANVRSAGLTVCSGIILGLGESEDDRISALHTYASMEKHPESFPVNALVKVEGTPMYEEPDKPVDVWDMGRMIATARILMPKTKIRLSAGRKEFSDLEQSMMFMAGANSIFAGDTLLTTKNQSLDDDQIMFKRLGMKLESHVRVNK